MIKPLNPNLPAARGAAEPIHPDFARWLRRDLVDGVPERLRPVAATSDYDALPWDLVLANPTGGAFQVTLPDRCPSGTEVAVKNASASVNTITIAPSAAALLAGHTVDGGASMSITTGYKALTFTFDAATLGWYAI